jgi:hypothetical protein
MLLTILIVCAGFASKPAIAQSAEYAYWEDRLNRLFIRLDNFSVPSYSSQELLAMKGAGSLDKYLEYYLLGNDRKALALNAGIAARRVLQRGDLAEVARFHTAAVQYEYEAAQLFSAAIDVARKSLDSAYAKVEFVYNASKYTAKGISLLCGPPCYSSVDKVFLLTDFAVRWSETGLGIAGAEAVTSVILDRYLKVSGAEEEFKRSIYQTGFYDWVGKVARDPGFRAAVLRGLAELPNILITDIAVGRMFDTLADTAANSAVTPLPTALLRDANELLLSNEQTVAYSSIGPTVAQLGRATPISITVTNTSSEPIANLWIGLDILDGSGKIIEQTRTPLNTTGGIQLSSQGQTLATAASRRFVASYTFGTASTQEAFTTGSYRYVFRAWKNGYPGHRDATALGELQHATVTITGAIDIPARPVRNQAPVALNMRPYFNRANLAASVTLNLEYNDQDGASDITSAELNLNGTLMNAGGCFLQYDAASKRISLMNDAGDAWLDSREIGSSGVLKNSQCSIDVRGISVAVSGATLTVAVPATFSSTFRGDKSAYMRAIDKLGSGMNWQIRGAWYFPR